MGDQFPDLKKITDAVDAYNNMLKNPDGGMGASEVDIKELGQVNHQPWIGGIWPNELSKALGGACTGFKFKFVSLNSKTNRFHFCTSVLFNLFILGIRIVFKSSFLMD